MRQYKLEELLFESLAITMILLPLFFLLLALYFLSPIIFGSFCLTFIVIFVTLHKTE